jgi:hypothetical protein
VTGKRSTFSLGVLPASLLLAGATLLSAGCCGSGNSGGLANLVPGHQEAEFRNRVENDSFPNASEALHAPQADAGNK